MTVPIRFDDAQRTIRLSVGALLKEMRPSPHLRVECPQSQQARMAAGRAVHTQYQQDLAAAHYGSESEVHVAHQFQINGWTCHISGRIDGVTKEGEHTVIEEVKSTALSANALLETTEGDWVDYVQQLQLYLWLFGVRQSTPPVGRLVLVSLIDGARHVLGIANQSPDTESAVRAVLLRVSRKRDERIQWMKNRQTYSVPKPFDQWRDGQEYIGEELKKAITGDSIAFVQAPTGLGKTAAVLYGALSVAMEKGATIFWATSRTTQQQVLKDTITHFRSAGLPLRAVFLNAKGKMCLQSVVDCRPTSCRFSKDYFNKVTSQNIESQLLSQEVVDRETLLAVGQATQTCPYALSTHLIDQVDIVIGDYNYVFDPDVGIGKQFSREHSRWIVIADEAHQLVDRARQYRSPSVSAHLAGIVKERMLEVAPEHYEPFIALCTDIQHAVTDACSDVPEPPKDMIVPTTVNHERWHRLAHRIDGLAVQYLTLREHHPIVPSQEDDLWFDLSRQVLRLSDVLRTSKEETVALADIRPKQEQLKLLCLDPSHWLGERLGQFFGFVAVSATLQPTDFYRNLMGIAEDKLQVIQVPSPFPPERRKVLVSPQISTAYADRGAHAEATALLIQNCVRAARGNVIVYFPSFEMLKDITARWRFSHHELMCQSPQMDEKSRDAVIQRFQGSKKNKPVLLAAVLGGIFAEGIDLPSNALSGVVIAGPGLPPIGTERDLLTAHYDSHYDSGFRYASLIPGMTRVIQAAGRLIRGEEDSGFVLLVGRRFRWREYTAVFPEDWNPTITRDPASEVAAFQASMSL